MELFGVTRDTSVEFSLESLSFDALFSDMSNMIIPILFGAVILAPLAAISAYWATYRFVELTRYRRMARMKAARQRYGRV